ncbi:MAG: hypothetical protein AABX51_07620 [Nanoarchaeota archaeon]
MSKKAENKFSFFKDLLDLDWLFDLGTSVKFWVIYYIMLAFMAQLYAEQVLGNSSSIWTSILSFFFFLIVYTLFFPLNILYFFKFLMLFLNSNPNIAKDSPISLIIAAIMWIFALSLYPIMIMLFLSIINKSKNYKIMIILLIILIFLCFSGCITYINSPDYQNFKNMQ